MKADRVLRLGVFGGSFHPPHVGHIEAAKLFLQAANPDLLLVIPAYLPPHKSLAAGATVDDRLAMARLAFCPLDGRVEVCDVEVQSGKACFTVDTLQALRAQYPKAELLLYVGSDMLASFETWHEFRRIFSLCRLFVLAREGDAENTRRQAEYLKRTYGADVTFFGECVQASSSAVREELATGATSALLCPAVQNYITERGLYRTEETRYD